MKAGGVKDDRGPRGVTKEEVSQDMKEGSFYGNDKMAKAAQDMGDSKSIVRMRDAKGTYTANMFRKQGEKNPKEISRVYDKEDVKEEVEEAVESPFTSYKKPREIESRGGSGIKQGTRYGGGKQKDVPTQDEAPKTKKPKGMMNFKEMFGE
jgi:hypothetical protein